MAKYLKDRSYYENLYDNNMIEGCRSIVKTLNNPKTQKKYSNEEITWIGNILIMATKHGYYANRENRITKMMDEDRNKDELFENFVPFENRHCRKCNGLLNFEFKEFFSGRNNIEDRILFFYKCSDCGKRHGIYNNGEERVSKPKLCNKCGEIIESKAKFEGDLLIEKYNCKFCGNKFTKKTDFSIQKVKKDKITEKERVKYGYTKEESEIFIEGFKQMEDFNETMKEYEEKDKKKDLYEKAKNLNKYNIVGLQKLLNKEFENTKFSEFKINSNKQVRKGLEIEFNLFFDGDFGENPKLELIKLFEKILVNSNWNIVKSSIYEKLGIVSGRLIGYDNEDDLVELIERREKRTKKKS